MKVGILTFHAGLNHGGFLQAHALQEFLHELGHEVAIVNYHNAEHWRVEHVLPWLVPQKPRTCVRHFRKWRAFRKDRSRLNLSPFIRHSDEIASLKLDVLVVGSDIVWNLELFGIDPAFFGGVNVPHRIAYAPSFGWMSEDTDLPSPVKEYLKHFDRILVRDLRTQAILKRNVNSEYPLVVDPTLLPLSGDPSRPWKRQTPLPRVLVYAHGLEAHWQHAIELYSRESGWDILSTGYPTGLPGKLDLNLGPFDWVDEINRSASIVTNTYHGTIYALLSGRPFLSIRKGQSASRIESLLGQVGCENRLVDKPEGYMHLLHQPLQDTARLALNRLANTSADLLKDSLIVCQ